MKYLNDLIRISIFVILLYVPLSWFTVKDAFQTLDQLQDQDIATKITNVKTTITNLLQQGRIVETCQRLKAEQEAGNVATYLLKSPDAECNYPEGMTTFPPIEKAGVAQRFLMDNKIPLLFLKDKTFNAEWAFSVSAPDKQGYLERITTNKQFRNALIKDIFIVIYLIFAFIFCAVLILAKSIQNQYRKKGKDPVWLKIINATFGKLQLHDMKIIKSATTILIQQNENLVKDKDLLETSLEYSILNEVRQNNHKIPYTFVGTVAKVDINGFSKVISAGDSVQSHNLTLFLEEFGCELLQRYNGLFEKTVGDEIIVIFKSEDSALFATAFSRDLMIEFSQLQFEIAGEKRNFTLKGAISSSELTFSKRAPGYGFNGDALTYSSRLLDMVTEKDRNFLSCLQPEGHKIQPLVHIPAQSKTFEFKNMSAKQGYLIDRFTTIDQVYNNEPTLIRYFRSDDAITFLLQKIQTEPDIKKIDDVITQLKQIEVRNCDQNLINMWTQTMIAVEAKGQTNFDHQIILSKLIMLGINLVPQMLWTDDCTQALLKINRQMDGRINASIVDVLIEKTLYTVALENETSFILKNDSSFRTRGNLLINQAYHSLDNAAFVKVLKMIESPNPLETNTGLFCACSIILHYQKINPAALETYAAYRKSVKILRKLKSNPKDLSPRLKELITSTLTQIDRHGRQAEFS